MYDYKCKYLIEILFVLLPFTELQILMGSLLFIRQGLADTPYSHLLDPINWLEICDIFTQDACALLGLSVESPLTVR